MGVVVGVTFASTALVGSVDGIGADRGRHESGDGGRCVRGGRVGGVVQRDSSSGGSDSSSGGSDSSSGGIRSGGHAGSGGSGGR